jgi:hypothetical protein
VQTVHGRCFREPGVDDAGLEHGAPALRIHREDAVHPGERDEHRVGIGYGAPGEPGARTPGHERDRGEVQQADDFPHLRRAGRHHDEAGVRLPGRQAVHRVRGQLGAPMPHPARADDAPEGGDEVRCHVPARKSGWV